MKKFPLTLVTAAAVALLFCASTLSFAQAPSKTAASDNGWDVTVYPVLAYVPVMGINVKLPDLPPCTACPPTTPPESTADSGLSGAAFFGLRVEKSRLAFEGTFNYAGLEASKSTPFVDVNLKAYIGAFKGGFMLAKGLWVEAGARYTGLDLSAEVLTYPRVNGKPGRWDALVGVTFNPQLSKRWRLQSHLDWIGPGGDAYSAVVGQARIEVQPVKFLVLTAGYGFSNERLNASLETERFGTKDVHFDYTLHGPVLGIGFRF